MTTPKN